MTTSSEEILLQVGQVRFKKGDGTLYLMSERLAWIMDHKDTVSVSHKYSDIKLQKISPEGKPKIQLQVVLHDNTTSTFQFVNRGGNPISIRDRDKVKDLLVTLLPKFKRKVNKELEEKNRFLSENPGLLQLYKDLVITQVITSEEFWNQHAAQYIKKPNHLNQQVGISSAFLADIKPQTDGCNGLKYDVTPEVMEAVFRTYPAVKQKHTECVPHKMSEKQFWIKFFQSHYFHRDRIHSQSTKDLFTDCAKMDDQVLSKEMTRGVSDPLVNVSNFEDKSLEDGYGTLNDKTPSQNIVHQNMIKRFNQHSIMVLKACQGSSNNIELPDPNDVSENHVNEMSNVKKRRIQEKIVYEDLDDTVSQQAAASSSKLNLSKVERYLQGPGGDSFKEREVSDKEAWEWWRRIKEECGAGLRAGTGIGHQLVPPGSAVSVLGDLTPGGALMKAFTEESLGALVTKPLATELTALYRGLAELLRHFWACFPPTTQQLNDKADRMHSAIRKFHQARLLPFENKVMLEFSPLSQELTSHLNQLLNTAYNKYEVWQSRRKPFSLPIR